MKRLFALVLCLLLLCGCGVTQSGQAEAGTSEETEEETTVVSVGGQAVVVDETLEQSGFSARDFSVDEGTGRIICLTAETLTGIDVSAYQGTIDWASVAEDGIDFAILRIGSRGYTQGGLKADTSFEENYIGATENGLLVGCYFFSQAISEAEAVEEAEYVLSLLEGRALDLPVVFDWEEITSDTARTDDLSGSVVTACALAFCQRIEQAGYSSAFYCNGSAGYLIYDISQLQQITAWYAEYGDWPSFAYAFSLWQYSKTGTVAGISGSVDLNLYFPNGTN